MIAVSFSFCGSLAREWSGTGFNEKVEETFEDQGVELLKSFRESVRAWRMNASVNKV